MKAIKIITTIIGLLVASFQSFSQDRKFDSNILKEYFNITQDSQSDYPIDEIMQGCSKVDCIPSIDKPEFIETKQVDFINDDDLVIAIEVSNESRVYPTTTLQQHEIVNDVIAGEPIAITYCPLCGTGVAFSRIIKGQVVEFGVSGVLHGSDLVMFDRQNKNLWQQLTGKAFAGVDRGYQLKQYPIVMTDWKTWKSQHTDSMVLSTSKENIKDRYKDYRNSDKVMFGGKNDPRLNPKRVIYGVVFQGQALAFDFELIKSNKITEYAINNQTLLVEYAKDGTVEIKEKSSRAKLHVQRSFWFAWFTFHPNTLLIKE
jgi:hypothetical protein